LRKAKEIKMNAFTHWRSSVLQRAQQVAIAAALLGSFACTSNSAARQDRESGTASNRANIDVMCMGDRINSPTEPFHYSFKYNGSFGLVEKEADITPQTMEITTKDKSGSHSFHGVRSDEQSWNSAVLDLSNLSITAMSSRLSSLNRTSAIVQNGPEMMNGYSATKYTIDTSNANAADKQRWEALFGQGSFEKGTAWVPADGCAVKLLLDEGMWQSGGSIAKAHYEIAMVKK
jgi:hypothetical protein